LGKAQLISKRDASQFPSITLLIGVAASDVPGFHPKMAETMVAMWQRNLGVKVNVETLDWEAFVSRIASNPPEIFRAIVFANRNDPTDFLPDFHTSAKYNFGGFSNSEFDQLLELAAKSNDPAKRQELYIQAEGILCETETAIIPIYHATYP
jgi:oligopeptide transport system substrate-binding protein